jgi:hypothetical protein
MPTRTIDCPICGATMQKKTVNNGVEVDYCDWHGIWLDAGELERLLASRQSAPASPPGGGVGREIAKGLAGAAVMGAGFGIGNRLVGGVLDALFRGRG